MKITPARPGDVAKLLAFREEAAAWLTRLGSDQWQRPYPAERLLATIQAGSAFMVVDGDVTAATITLSQEAEEGLWTKQELSEPSSFVTKLTVARTHAGQNLGGRLLDWAGDRDIATVQSGYASTPGRRTRRFSSTIFGKDFSTCALFEKGRSQRRTSCLWMARPAPDKAG